MTKQEKYEQLMPQLMGLIDGETNAVSVMANVAAMLHDAFGWWWTGFYTVSGHKLELGPFQGPVACYRIKCGRGVCGTAWERNETVIVPDVEQFSGHIACSSLSRSEIVVPVHDAEGKVQLSLCSTSIAKTSAPLTKQTRNISNFSSKHYPKP